MNLAVPADDGLMQVSMVEDDQSSGDFANWTLTPLTSGNIAKELTGGMQKTLSRGER